MVGSFKKKLCSSQPTAIPASLSCLRGRRL